MTKQKQMESVIEISGSLRNGRIVTAVESPDLVNLVLEEKKIVLLKNVFPPEMLIDLRRAVVEWGRKVEPLAVDDFDGNYHRQRAMVSHLHNFPHVLHDYNFHDFAKLEERLRAKLLGLFDPLRLLYNDLAAYDLNFEIPTAGPYLHPQLIHYPSGGGFFGRHWHNLLPQKLGFIVALSRYGSDYKGGGTVFDLDGQVVDIEGLHDLGDVCIWRYDYPHWVKQSDLRDQFAWNSEGGRWVATLPYFAKW